MDIERTKRQVEDIPDGTEFEYFMCAQCRGETRILHLGKHQFEACDACQIYWGIGYNLFTPYEQSVYSGAFDDFIGGEQNRDLAIVENDLKVTELLEKYQGSGVHACFEASRLSVRAG